jgi:hypothetical protein
MMVSSRLAVLRASHRWMYDRESNIYFYNEGDWLAYQAYVIPHHSKDCVEYSVAVKRDSRFTIIDYERFASLDEAQRQALLLLSMPS